MLAVTTAGLKSVYKMRVRTFQTTTAMECANVSREPQFLGQTVNGRIWT